MEQPSRGSRKDDWLSVSPGRALRFSPDWNEEAVSVLFDRNSGDYWVVTSLARSLVARVESGPARVDMLLGDEDVTALADVDGYNVEQTEAVVAQLLELGILSRHDAPPDAHEQPVSPPD